MYGGTCLTVVEARLLQNIHSTTSLPALLLELNTDEGQPAFAEVAGEVSSREAQQDLEQFQPLLLGRQPLERGAIWERMALQADWHGHMSASTAAVFSAVDMALWQLAANQAKLPLHKLLGGRYFPRMDTYEFFRDEHLDQRLPPGGVLLEASSEADRAIALAERLRRRWGDQARLLVAFRGDDSDLQVALNQARKLQNVEAFWCADLLPVHFAREYRQLTQAVEVPVGAGAHARGLRDHQRLFRERSVDLLVVDVRFCGGLTGAQRLAYLASAQQLPAALLGGRWPLTLLLVLHLASTSSTYLPVARPADEGLLQPAVTVQDGFVTLSDEVGLGAIVSPDLLSSYAPVGTA